MVRALNQVSKVFKANKKVLLLLLNTTDSDRSWETESICELKMEIPPNKLYSTEHIELLRTIGQGIHVYSSLL